MSANSMKMTANERVARITNVFDQPLYRMTRISLIATNEMPNGIIPVSCLSFLFTFFFLTFPFLVILSTGVEQRGLT